MSRTLFVIPLAALLLAAGCVAPAPEEVDAAAATTEDPDVAKMATPEQVSLDGDLGLSAFVCPAATCAGQTVMPSKRIFETGGWGPLAISLTLEWEATTPATEQLLFGVFTCDHTTCTSDDDLTQVEFVYGASPLTFETEELKVADGETLYVFVNVGGNSAGPVFARTMTPQGFHVEGLLSPQP